MFGPRLTRVFASRWSALWWAASILLLAWQLVPDEDDAGGDPLRGAASAQAQPVAAGNPWALATPAPTPAGER
ncbi:hypothetical protein H7F51_06100 [Novosphingobium flavum]|uniref:Uncharacterized protein n=1 Tax=Novosphingobium flavum TaxID=1778672 RepID=A0A7X1KL21_9SPHN|nr:hypothetical protein [Novosphingobium flavum]MBC2665082.1 hypothetical protein [Novosphingobium flavum]